MGTVPCVLRGSTLLSPSLCSASPGRRCQESYRSHLDCEPIITIDRVVASRVATPHSLRPRVRRSTRPDSIGSGLCGATIVSHCSSVRLCLKRPWIRPLQENSITRRCVSAQPVRLRTPNHVARGQEHCRSTGTDLSRLRTRHRHRPHQLQPHQLQPRQLRAPV